MGKLLILQVRDQIIASPLWLKYCLTCGDAMPKMLAHIGLQRSPTLVGFKDLPSKENTNAAVETAESTGVILGQFYKHISSEIEDERNFASIGATMLLIIAFVMVASGILCHEEVFAVQETVWNDLFENANFAFVGPMGNKIFKDVHSVGDFWSWLHVGAVPRAAENYTRSARTFLE